MIYNMTFSTWDIKIEGNIVFPVGVTAGYILAINPDGTTYWKENN